MFIALVRHVVHRGGVRWVALVEENREDFTADLPDAALIYEGKGKRTEEDLPPRFELVDKVVPKVRAASAKLESVDVLPGVE